MNIMYWLKNYVDYIGGSIIIIKKCDKCGAEIRELPETQAILPKYYIYKCVSGFGVQSIDVNLCYNCEEKFDEWLSINDEDKYNEWLKENFEKDINKKIAELETENERLRNEMLLNEQINNEKTLLIKNEMEYYEKQKHWFRNFVEKIFRR